MLSGTSGASGRAAAAAAAAKTAARSASSGDMATASGGKPNAATGKALRDGDESYEEMSAGGALPSNALGLWGGSCSAAVERRPGLGSGGAPTRQGGP